MGGLHEWPLVIFTVLAQSAVGGAIILLWAATGNKTEEQNRHTNYGVFALLVLMGIGFICSILHLGSPLRAFNSLNRVGSSMLSNEIATGSLFFALLGLYWLLSVLKKGGQKIHLFGALAVTLAGLLFMFMMNNVYHISTVPTWDNSFTSWSFYLTIVLGGSVLGYALSNTERKMQLAWLRWVFTLGVILAIAVAFYQFADLAHIQTPAKKALDLVPDYASIIATRLLLLVIALGLFFYQVKQAPTLWLSSLMVIAVLGAEMLGRTLFYALHMTVGTAF